MKVNFLGKAKWYVVGFILVAIMLSVSLSFCTWDTLSAKASMNNSESGSYYEAWDNYIKDSNGNKLTKAPTVGQVVRYGNFYQDTDAVSTGKTAPQRWIVVDYNTKTKVATLLAEKVVVYGSFWGSGGAGENFYQNYYQSTVRSWLNSGKGSLKGSGTNWNDSERDNDNTRNDGLGSKFSGTADKQVNRGFLDVAFTAAEKSILIPNKITGMAGKGIKNNPSTIDTYKTTDNKAYINDLVWLPSYQEIYGTKENPWSDMTMNDGTPNTKISYFNDVLAYGRTIPKRSWVSAKAISGATAYAWNAGSSSYYNNGGGGNVATISATWWWLRSAETVDAEHALIVHVNGDGNNANAQRSNVGVRPAVCVQL